MLSNLPGAGWRWIAVWACVPWINAGLNSLLETDTRSAVWEQDRTLVLLNYAALSFAVVIALWGTRRLTRRIDSLRATTSGVVQALDAGDPFRAVNKAWPPLVGALLTAVAFAASALFSDGAIAAILRGTTWLIIAIALWTFLWTYASLQFGLDRLGHERLALDAARVDPGLGLRPLGDIAFMALWMLLAWLVPLVLTGLPDVVGAVLGVLLLAGGLATFFLSLLRLHRQMVAVKRAEIAFARDLYAQAYEPVRASPTLATLEQQSRLLSAADALEKRARAIHDWPIDEGTFARVLTIATSVVAITIGRLILDPLGL